jgi:hypothetical protein
MICKFIANVAARVVENRVAFEEKRSNYHDRHLAQLARWLRKKAESSARVTGGTEDAWWYDLWRKP